MRPLTFVLKSMLRKLRLKHRIYSSFSRADAQAFVQAEREMQRQQASQAGEELVAAAKTQHLLLLVIIILKSFWPRVDSSSGLLAFTNFYSLHELR